MKVILLDKADAYKLLQNQRIASKIEIRELMSKVDELHLKMNKIEMDCTKKLRKAADALVEEKRNSTLRVQAARRVSARTGENRLDKLAERYDDELSKAQDKFAKQKES